MGALMTHGYRALNFDGVSFLEHRAAVAWMTGSWPSDEVDHLNLDRSDNRWSNLRVATRNENTRNGPKRSGWKFKGITPHPGGRWKAQIMLDRRQHYLGIFATQEEAHAAYVNAAANLHGKFSSFG